MQVNFYNFTVILNCYWDMPRFQVYIDSFTSASLCKDGNTLSRNFAHQGSNGTIVCPVTNTRILGTMNIKKWKFEGSFCSERERSIQIHVFFFKI